MKQKSICIVVFCLIITTEILGSPIFWRSSSTHPNPHQHQHHVTTSHHSSVTTVAGRPHHQHQHGHSNMMRPIVPQAVGPHGHGQMHATTGSHSYSRPRPPLVGAHNHQHHIVGRNPHYYRLHGLG